MQAAGTPSGVYTWFCLFVHTFLIYTNAADSDIGSNIYGFHHIGITTSHLEISRKFYVDVLGGTLISDLTGRNFQGNEEMYVLFQKEVLEARSKNISLSDAKVPDVTTGGSVGLSLYFVLFDNLVVELLEYNETTMSQAYSANYKHKSAAYVNTVTASFWVKDDVDLDDFIKRLETASGQRSIPIKANHVSVAGTATASFDSSQVNLQGMSVAHVTGPSGELIEFVKITGESRLRFKAAFAAQKAVTKAFSSDTSCTRDDPLRNCLYGVHHIGVTTDDFTASLKFYRDVMGGTVLTSLTGNNLYADELYKSLFQQEIEETDRDPAALTAAGIPDISNDGTEKYDTVFVLFANMIVRLGRFSSRPAGDLLFNASHSSSSPAFISSGHLTFWVKNTTDLNQLIRAVETASRTHGLSQVQGNRAVDVAADQLKTTSLSHYSYSISGTGSSSSFDGLSYTYMKGPSGEQLEFFQVKGKANDAFRNAFCERGAVSTAYSCPKNGKIRIDPTYPAGCCFG